MSEPIKVVFLGSGVQGLPTLKVLQADPFELITVITQPDRPAGRGGAAQSTPIKAAARDQDVPTLESPVGVALPELLKDLSADVYVVVDFGQIIPASLVETQLFVNIHFSLLPEYRGTSPYQTAILNGDTETGVTLFQIDREIDHGPIISQRVAPIEPRETTASLSEKLAPIGASLIQRDLPRLITGELTAPPQDHAQATFTKKFTKEDGRLDWYRPAEVLDRRIRALNPWPGTFTSWNGKQLKILGAEPSDTALASGHVGAGLTVGAGEGALRVTHLQLEGKNAVAAEEFLRGYPSIIGSVLRSQS